ncbi:MAG: CHASE2 domain-containing protein [Betaproteobacteria bacterium]
MPLARVAPLRVSALVVLLLTVAGVLLSLVPQARLVDLKLVDVDFGLLRQIAPHRAPDDFVLIGIDAATVRSPADLPAVWQRQLGGLLRGLAASKPQIVILEAGLPAQALKPAEDAELIAGLLAVRRTAPVIAARPRAVDGTEQDIHPEYAAAIGSAAIGTTQLPLDPDARQRRLAFFAGEPPRIRETVLALAAKAISPTIYHAPAMIDFALGAKYDYLPLSAALEITSSNNAEALRRRFGDRIVLVGLILPNADRHPLALNLMSGERSSMAAPGVALQAQALRTVIHGNPIMPFPDWLLWPLYLLPACLFLLRRGGTVLLGGIALFFSGLAGKLWALHVGSEVAVAGLLASVLLAMLVWQGFAGRRPS